MPTCITMRREIALAIAFALVAPRASAETIDDVRAAVENNPRDLEARAALISRLIWAREFDAADRELDAALAIAPNDPALLARRAQLLHFRGLTGDGRPYVARAEARAPYDIDIRTLGDRMWLGEARLRARHDFFPSGYDDIPTWELSIYQRLGRAMIGARTEQVRRQAEAYGLGSYNAFYAGSLSYAVGVGWTLGVEGGFGAPARAVPEALGRGFLYFPIAGPVDGYAAYTYMTYANGTRVHMVNPAIGVQVTDSLRIDGRYWLARARIPEGDSKIVHSFGGYALYRIVPRLAVDALYIYGTQLDRLPAVFQLGEVKSHIVATGIDWRIVRELGIRPQYQLEIRKNPRGDVIQIHSGELAVYVRW